MIGNIEVKGGNPNVSQDAEKRHSSQYLKFERNQNEKVKEAELSETNIFNSNAVDYIGFEEDNIANIVI